MRLLLVAALALLAAPAAAQQLPFSSTDTAISENFEWLASQIKKNTVAINDLQGSGGSSDTTSYFTTPVQISTSIAGQPPNAAPRANTIYSDNQIRAWAVIVGTGTAWVPASFNVSSFSDLGTGLYQINFATPMQAINGRQDSYILLCGNYRTDVTNNEKCGPFAGGSPYFVSASAAFSSQTTGGGNLDSIVFGVVLGGKQ